jgi:hypothetical protein
VGEKKPATQAARIDQSTLDQMRRWGASDEDIALAQGLMQQQAQSSGEECEVWPDNWEAWQAFLMVSRQWIYVGPDHRRAALNWPGIEVVTRALGWRGKRWADLVQALLAVESEVIRIDNEQAAQG